MSKERVEMIFLTNKKTYFKGWIHLSGNMEVEKLLIDRRSHPNFQEGQTLPEGHILIPCGYGMREQPRKTEK